MAKNNKFAHLNQTQAELDFHNRGILSKTDIKQLCENFIQESLKKKLNKILFITGKGLHSRNNEAVVKPIVQAYLQKHPNIQNFYTAAQNKGGSGAIEARLIVNF